MTLFINGLKYALLNDIHIEKSACIFCKCVCKIIVVLIHPFSAEKVPLSCNVNKSF